MSTHPLNPNNNAAQPHKRPLVVGLIGGVASGKSTIARALSEHGALWLDCDKIAHRVLEEPDVVHKLKASFSTDILDPQGLIERKRVAAIVFGEDAAASAHRHRLEELVHPRVRAIVEQCIEEAGHSTPVIVIDAALLIEAGWKELCDRVVFVDTPQHVRERLATNRGWPSEELAKREHSQLAIANKRRQATDTIANDSTIAALRTEVERFWKKLAL